MTDRAVAPVVGTLLLVGVVLVAGSALAAASGAVRPDAPASLGPHSPSGVAPPSHGGNQSSHRGPPAAFSLSASGDRLAVTYERGPPIPVARLRLEIAVDGIPLTHQPPVPFFSARGFRSGPTGPFNVGSDGVWSAGETGAVVVAGTNAPRLEPGRTVSVRLYRENASRPVATLRAAIG